MKMIDCPYDVYYQELLNDGFESDHAHTLAWTMWMDDLEDEFDSDLELLNLDDPID